ncbi:hypothetical protein F9879_19145, partial [Morganella morganii]|nr:hypothetical protein [Morganella morganii]
MVRIACIQHQFLRIFTIFLLTYCSTHDLINNLNFGNTLPDAIDSGHGAVAYLYDLLTFVERMIEPKGDSDKAITLKQRRPDIYNILLNEENVNGSISKIQ